MRWFAAGLFTALLAAGCRAQPSTPPTTRRSALVGAPAPAPAPWTAKAYRFMPANYYSYGVTVLRGRDGCEGTRFFVANGYDHTPQFLTIVGAGLGCMPGETVAHSPSSLHYADVVAGDFDDVAGDEVVMAALAGARETLDTGGLQLWSGGDAATWIDRGFAASALAAGDLDLDGDLDLVVGTFWDGGHVVPVRRTTCDDDPPMQPLVPAGEAAGLASMFGFPFGTPRIGPRLRSLARGQVRGPVLIYTQEAPGRFRLRSQLHAPGPARVRLADLDLDGDLDLVLAGTQVRIVDGPLLAPGDAPLACERLPWSGDNPVDAVFAPDVDVVRIGDELLVAASESCFSVLSCMRLTRPRVVVWRRDASGEWSSQARAVGGLPAAIRFTWLPGDDVPDLLVGRLSEQDVPCDCATRPVLGGLCVGAPLLAIAGAAGPGGWTAGEPAAIDLRVDGASHYPMSFRLLPHVDDTVAVTTAQQRVAARPATRVVGFDGVGWVLGATAVDRASGKPVTARHVYGDRHVTLAASTGEVDLTWQVARTTNYLLTNTSPLAGVTGGNLYVLPPAHTDR